jgi:hypothetical protein
MEVDMRQTVVAIVFLMTMALPAAADCERCVIGGDNLAWCRPEYYLPVWPLRSNCEPITRCHVLANGAVCYPDCDGAWCYEV